MTARPEFPPPGRQAPAGLGRQPRSFRLRVALAFGVIYILWGTTYLVIRIALIGIPPAYMSGLRFILAGSILLGVARIGGAAVHPPGASLPTLAGIGGLLVAANWGIVWSEQYVTSGVAALVFATAPLCIAALSAAISPAERLSLRAGAGLVLGFAGVAILVWPKVSHGVLGDVRGEAALVVAALVWSVASVWAKHAAPSLAPFVAAGWQMFLGGTILLLLGLVLGEPARAQWGWASTVAFGYLSLIGSCLGYGCYIWLLRHVSAARVATFAFVHPVVAVVLGWALLDEPIGVFVTLGTLIIVPAVFLTITAVAPRPA